MLRLCGCLLVVALFARPAALLAEDHGIRVPEGFEVSLYADDALAHDIFSMTVDSQGRVVVAGAGYVKILHDADGDGRAESATLFSALPSSGAHGMFFDGPDLICTGDNSVMRLRDTDGDGVADREPEVWTNLRHPEHGANGLVRGPDGCYYVICGNDSGLSAKQITTPSSPVRIPRSGGVARFSPNGRPLDVYAHGFRNPYDLDFDAEGRMFTVDSDGERDHHLPWYAPNRLFDVAQGMEHGWLLSGWTRGWNRPQSFFDNVERMVEIGRGSPTGVAVYRHRGFPEHYRGGVFSACWTFGRVYYFPIELAGATAKSKLEVFMQTAGDVGFAPCDLAVGPQGDLFIAIGGRHTRGSVFRVRYNGPRDDATRDEGTHSSPLEQVLKADQPLASWSRARWVPIARQLGQAAFEEAVGDDRLDSPSRIRAVEVLVEVFGGLDPKPAEAWAQSTAPAVRARVAWALGRGPSAENSEQLLAQLTSDADPRVERAAWEALATGSPLDPQRPRQPDWLRGLTSSERRVRAAAIAVAQSTGQASYREFISKVRTASDALALRLAQLWIKRPADPQADAEAPAEADIATCLEVYVAANSKEQIALEAVRLLQLALGDVRVAEGQAEVYSGYVANARAKLGPALARRIVRQLAPTFPTPLAELNRELARLFGMLRAEHAGLHAAIARMWTAESTVDDDLHYLIVASLLDGPRSSDFTTATAACLLGLHKKLDDLGQFASRNWPLRVGELFDELYRRDGALADALVGSSRFGHVDHALFAARLPDNLRRTATRLLWSAAMTRQQEPTPELISLVGRLPDDEALGLLRSQWDAVASHDPIVLALARYPNPVDRSKFVEALSSPQGAVVAKAAQALVALGINSSSSEIAAALRALKQACATAKDTEPRQSLLRLLNFWTEENSDVDVPDEPDQAYVGWFEMFSWYYPAEAAKLNASSKSDAETWNRRLAQVDWTRGDAVRGRTIYEARNCHRCHQASGHLGPELKGALSRLSRDDLFTAIVDPNLEVSPAFQTTLVATNSGQVYHGLVVYESPEGTLLQTGPDTTVRITDLEMSSMRRSNQSLMPSGLLDPLSDQDLSDLYAHLKTLGAQ